MEGPDRIDILHRSVGSVDENGAGLLEFLPHVGAFENSRFTQPLGGPGQVGRAVDSLNGSDDAQFSESRYVAFVQDLRMLVAETDVLFLRMRLEGGLERIQDRAIAGISDRVDVDLEAILDPVKRGFPHHGRVGDPEPGVAGIVEIRFEQLGSSGAQGAVNR